MGTSGQANVSFKVQVIGAALICGREEHFKRSPNCAFFTLIGNHKQSPAGKRTKAKNHRASKASRLSTQSAFTINSDTASVTDLPAEEGDSILTTATNATTFQGGKRMAKGKKPTTTKGRKTKAKKSEAVEVLPAPEPEDDDFEVKVDLPPKSTRGRKRKTEDVIDSAALMEEMVALPSKRRATRTRASVAGNDSALGPDDSTMAVEPSKLVAAGRKKGRQSTRKASAASMASLRAPIPNDDELDAALEADLEQRMTDDEDHPIMAKASSRNLSIADHNMFGTEGVKIDEVAIDAELIAMEEGSKALPKAKGAKGKLPRKVSAKQQAAAKKAAEAEAAAQKGIEEGEDVSRRTSTELEQSISTHHSSPVIKPKRQRVSRQPSRQLPGRSTRGSVLSVNESHVSINDDTIMLDQNDESGNETDASMASQSTVVRASKNRRGSTLRRAKGGKKAETRHIEEIVHKTTRALSGSVDTSLPVPLIGETEDVSTADERFYTPAPEAHDPIIEEPVPQISKPNTSKPRGRPLKAAAEPAPSQQRLDVEKHAMEEQPAILPREKLAKVSVALPVRIQTPPLKERTPSESPQSSDAENHPPSSKPTASSKRVVTPRATVARVPLAASTPSMSPSKRNIIAGLQTTQPWTGVDLDAIFLKTPGNENAPSKGMLGDALDKARKGYLTSPEKKMTVEEWIHHNAGMAEEKLRSECERMVGTFEREGARAMIALEGIDCVE